MQNTRKQTKTNGKKCQKATTRFFFVLLFDYGPHVVAVCLSGPGSARKINGQRTLLAVIVCSRVLPPWFIALWVTICSPVVCQFFDLQCMCGSCLCYQRLATVTDSPQKRGGAGLRKAVGRSKQRAKKFHLRVSLLDTFSIHQLCLSIKLITNSIKTH